MHDKYDQAKRWGVRLVRMEHAQALAHGMYATGRGVPSKCAPTSKPDCRWLCVMLTQTAPAKANN